MTTLEEQTGTAARRRPEPQPPYGAYASIMASFGGLLAVGGALGRLRDQDPEQPTWLDFVALTLATFKASRTIARDEVTSFMREPFVEGHAHEGQEERPVQTGGMEQAIGELVTCSRCVGTWAAGALATTQILAPRFGRLLTWSLAAAGINDWLQAGFAALTEKANELESQAG